MGKNMKASLKKILISVIVPAGFVAVGFLTWTFIRPIGPGEGFVSGNGRIEPLK